MKKLSFFFAVLFVLTMILPVAAQAEIGTEENPIKVLFVPSVEANTIVTGGEIMAKALHDATGYFFEVSVPTSFAATVEEMCASPDNTMGFIPAKPYVMASELCGVDVAFAALRYGLRSIGLNSSFAGTVELKKLKILQERHGLIPMHLPPPVIRFLQLCSRKWESKSEIQLKPVDTRRL